MSGGAVDGRCPGTAVRPRVNGRVEAARCRHNRDDAIEAMLTAWQARSVTVVRPAGARYLSEMVSDAIDSPSLVMIHFSRTATIRAKPRELLPLMTTPRLNPLVVPVARGALYLHL